MMEVWKDIPGYEGLYQISNLQRVKTLAKEWPGYNGSLIKRKEKVLKPRVDKDGYKCFAFYKNGKYKVEKLHRLVAFLEVPNPNNHKVVNHKDGNKQNNIPSNLEWVTVKQNNIHAWATGLHKKRFGLDHHRSRPVRQLDLHGNLIKTFGSIREVTRELGFHSGNISRHILGNPKFATVHGFKWERA